MNRLAILVEGPTEEEFVNLVLAEHLREKGIEPTPISLNGGVNVYRLAAEMANLSWNFDAVTSLVDFYGFRGKGNATLDELEERIKEEISQKVRSSDAHSRVFAYVQQYEFEGLLFSDVSAFGRALIVQDKCVDELLNIRAEFPTPEDINNSPNTAPSKRIKNVIPLYGKHVDGPLIAEEIGLRAIRAECPRFNEWVKRMESLGDAP